MQQPAIRQLYTPLQPAVRKPSEGVTYREWLPCGVLQDYIYCYWELRSLRRLDEGFAYRVVADGCIDIFFELDRPEAHFVMGFSSQYTAFDLDPSFHYIGIRFLPAMFPQLFRVDAAGLSNRYEALDAVLPHTAAFIRSTFHQDMPPEFIRQHLDAHFLRVLAAADPYRDPRLYEAITIILARQGMLDVEQDLATGISLRQLRRLFTHYIGDTPKVFSKVVRFQSVLRAKPSLQSLRRSKLFFDAGYYDQAHFIKEFRNFYGLTPSKAFAP